jgi:dienelactone hydrolase
MKKLLTILLLLPLFALGQEAKTKNEESALKLLEHLQEGKFDKIVRSFDTTMTRKLPADDLKFMWRRVSDQLGPIEKVVDLRSVQDLGVDIVLIKVRFERLPLVVKVIFNDDNDISGFFLVPTPTSIPYSEPDYVLYDSLMEQDITVTTWPFNLKGAYTYPRHDTLFPVVVLVHGTGAHDMDETIGPNRPFKDLSLGLASRGVGVVRYVKRNKAYDAQMAVGMDTITVEEEVIQDAVSALELARTLPGADPNRIYLVGHSLGAMLAPRIAEAAPWIKGIILMAAPARPLEDLIMEQYHYILGLDGLNEEDKKVIDEMTNQIANVKSSKLSAAIPSRDLPMGMPASYWLDLRDYDPVTTALKIPQPILVLQGEKDYQVTMTDFKRWVEELNGTRQIEYRSFPGMTHLFSEGEGVPADYSEQNNVDLEVMQVMIRFIKKENHE